MLFSCKNDIKKIKLLTKDYAIPIQSAKDIEILYSSEGKVKIKLTAPLLNRYNDKEKNYTEFPKGIHVIFYDSLKNIESEISAKKAIYYQKDEFWLAKDSVVAINTKNEILHTEELFWYQQKAIIKSDKFVKVTTNEEIIYGNGFESNESFTKWKILNIKGSINIKDE